MKELVPYFLTTERLWLRQLTVVDAVLVKDYYNYNENHFKPYIPKLEFPLTEDFAQRILAVKQERKALGQSIDFWLFLKNEEVAQNIVIGDISFSQIFKGPFLSCYLGYKMHEDYIGQGLMIEALYYTIQYMFKEIGLHRIEINVMPNNEKSIQLAKKLGFKKEGYSPKYLKINGTWEDHERYVLINESMKD